MALLNVRLSCGLLRLNCGFFEVAEPRGVACVARFWCAPAAFSLCVARGGAQHPVLGSKWCGLGACGRARQLQISEQVLNEAKYRRLSLLTPITLMKYKIKLTLRPWERIGVSG